MGTKIKIARIEIGLKQKDLAKDLGISQNYLGQLENNKAKNPSLKLMRDISNRLGYSVQYLFFS
ncbi:helix-turn-helix transcriptional regulator [Cellulosilyticum sp. WCF-2]|uniref:helix-turn-helix transcriptional regulator n=1 Tax=Cellulosilyticum sp. WCF-2 TaxID=2497860 RepID=UPI000F8EE6BD|nr:helix-turn-helix transcriptional regulator [Cellulosilyticum sp. WCF-2]QEH68614.1 helix-turn-helix transcriptional regulator [Cellulosilyticum sp. WCF-2]